MTMFVMMMITILKMMSDADSNDGDEDDTDQGNDDDYDKGDNEEDADGECDR